MNSNLYKYPLALLLLLFSLQKGFATEEFEPSTVILEHIVDNHEVHLFSIGTTDVIVHLPIIIFDNWKPFCCLSSKFEEGKHAYKGYCLGFTKETHNKIIKLTDKYAGYTGEITPAMINYVDNNSFIIDISITKNVATLISSVLLIVFIFISVAKKYKKTKNSAPKGFQALIELLIVYVRDNIVKPSIGEKKYEQFLPYLLTLFFFIFLNNLMGLIPIFPFGSNLTGNIVVTGMLALITFIITLFASKKTYWKHIFNTPGAPWWLKIPIPMLPLVEFIGVFTKPIVLMIRLFANMTGGHIVVLGFVCLIFIFGALNPVIGYAVSPVSILFYIFISLLELIVSFVQAFVFTLLTSIYIGSAIEEKH